jgi:hypothetical protein
LGDRITYVGLDVHKEGIAVAVAEGGLRGEVRDYGRIANTPAALRGVRPKPRDSRVCARATAVNRKCKTSCRGGLSLKSTRYAARFNAG